MLTTTTSPALYQPLLGEIEPPTEAAVVRKYCVVNAAVYVVADIGVVTECDAAPPSDQLVKRYCTPTEPACDAAATNAGVTQSLAGASAGDASLRAARAFLAGQPGVRGSATVHNGVVTVTTRASERTLFLSLIGVDSVSATGTARSNAVGPAETR